MSANAFVVQEIHGGKRGDVSEKLTPRELEVLVLLADGFSTKEIAFRLGMAFKTAACHRNHIMRKFGAQNSVMILRHAIRVGLIQP